MAIDADLPHEEAWSALEISLRAIARGLGCSEDPTIPGEANTFTLIPVHLADDVRNHWIMAPLPAETSGIRLVGTLEISIEGLQTWPDLITRHGEENGISSGLDDRGSLVFQRSR